MKKLMYLLLTVASLITSFGRFGFADDVDGYIFRSSGLAVSTAPVFDVGGLDRMSVQVNYASATPSAVTVLGGRKSTATITVGSNFALLGDATAQASITITSNDESALSGSIITINGYELIEGTHWTRQAASSNTARSLAAAISLYTQFVSTNNATGTVVYSSAPAYGTAGNAYTITSSTPAALTLSGAKFTGGRDRGFVSINGTVLYAGVDFSVGASSAATATNIAAAINANSVLSTIVVATAPTSCSSHCGVIKSTSTSNDVNAYSLTTSSYAMLTPSGNMYVGGQAGNINSVTDVITKSNTFGLGADVMLGATAISGLTKNTTYYAIPVVAGSSFKLSDTSTGAIAGVAMDISTSAVQGESYTLTPATCTTGASFVLQQSNDNANWVTAPSTGTVTLGQPSGTASLIYDAGLFNFKYLRFNYTAPTKGAIAADIAIHGKR